MHVDRLFDLLELLGRGDRAVTRDEAPNGRRTSLTKRMPDAFSILSQLIGEYSCVTPLGKGGESRDAPLLTQQEISFLMMHSHEK